MIRVGVICPSEIAFRRFMPALQQIEELKFVGLAVCTAEERFGENLPDSKVVHEILSEEKKKAGNFARAYGGKIFESYQAIAQSEEIDALYIPLPPALHFKWAKEALQSGKHVMAEKPCTLRASDTMDLIHTADAAGLALHENYMFAFHEQLAAIGEMITAGEIGEVRLYRISFGFPRRAENDFRYNKSLGGGSLFDCGGYTLRYAGMLLGETAKIVCAELNYTNEFAVDLYGSATLTNEQGVTVQVAFGMDNNYKCELEVWGSKGSLVTGRVLTAPAGFVPEVSIFRNHETDTWKLPEDDAFKKSLQRFIACTKEEAIRRENYKIIARQAEMVDDFVKLAGES